MLKHSIAHIDQDSTPGSTDHLVDKLLARINKIIVGRTHPIRLALACLLAKGHLLIEDVPGVGKTTLAHALATALGLDFMRIQFTSDLLPADVIGVSIYDTQKGVFKFHPGPVFSQLVLADEINRATPKAQSALLEAMEERQVTAEGRTHALPKPFFVIATQNPNQQIGTFPLPESQLDRFLMRIEIGFPDVAAERVLLKGQDRRELLSKLEPMLDTSVLLNLQQQCQQVRCSDALIDYVQALLNTSRNSAWLRYGLSPRAGIALTNAAKAWAYMARRNIVLPEDIQAVAPSVFHHRLQGQDPHNSRPHELVEKLVQSVPIP